jgi:hypothetical protein
MTGIEGFNFPAFHAAAAAWRAVGWEVVNPAEPFDGVTDLPYRAYVTHDLDRLVTCDAIAMLPGWDGKGARGSVWEREVAERLLHLLVYDATTIVSPPGEPSRSILVEAEGLVHGDRQRSYGHPLDDFSRTAALASALFGWPIKPEDVGLFMCLVKLSRQRNKPKRDNLTDLAGYAETVQMVIEEQGRRNTLQSHLP